MLSISIQQLSKYFKTIKVLDIPLLELNAGEVFGVVGNNGAGKSTLFRLMLDLIQPSAGNVTMNKCIVNENDEWKNFTGAYLDQSFLLDFLKPEEYFYFIGDRYGLNKSEVNARLEKFASFFGGEVLGQKRKFIRDMSSGNKQKVGIAGVFLIEPKIIILDEPFNALDPTSQMVLKNIIIDYHRSHEAITLVSSHDLNHITALCTRIVLMEKGNLIKDTAVSESTLSELQQYFNKL